MKADQIALQRALRSCYEKMIADPGIVNPKSGKKNAWNVTSPAALRQEIAYAATTTQYNFQFAANAAPAASATLNNVNMGENDIFWFGAVQVLYGLGATSNNRQYFSRGFTPSDDILYNSTMEITIESGTPVINVPMQWFREEGEVPSLCGIVVIPQVRRLSGDMSNISFNINLGKTSVNITGATLTANAFISVSPLGVQARP